MKIKFRLDRTPGKLIRLFQTSLLLLFTLNLSAQCEPGAVSLTCDKIGVVIKAANADNNPCYTCGFSPTDCHRIQFQVYLVADIPLSSQAVTLCYTDLSVTLAFSNAVGGNFPFLSTLNESASILCSTGYGFEQLLDVDDKNKEVVLTTVGSGQHPPIVFTRGANNPLIECVPGKMRAQLCTIVVDGWNGELVTASCKDLALTRPESGILDLNGDGLFSCDEDGTADEDMNTVVNTTVLGCSGAQSSVVPLLTPQPNLTVDVGGVDATNMPDYGLIPVTCNTTLSSVKYLDFMIRLNVDKLMTMPEIIPGDIMPLPGYPRVDKIPSLANPNIYDYVIYSRYENVTFQLNANKFFDIKVNAPEFMSAGGTVCPEFQLGRLVTNSGCGAVQFSEAGECVEFEDLPVCSDKYTINVSGDPISGIQQDCKVQVLVGFNWAPSEDVLSFHAFKLQLDFEAPDNVVLEDVDLSNAISCPGSNNPIACNGFMDCYSVIDGHTLSICFKQGAPGEFLTINRNNAYIILTFDAPENCVSGVKLRHAEFGRVTFDPMTQIPIIHDICRLETPDQSDPGDPFFTVQGFPICVPYLNSEVKNDKATPEAIIEAIIHIDGPGSCDSAPLSDCDGYAECVCNYGQYTVTPEKDDNPLNGVTTYDLVLISKNILGIEPILPFPHLNNSFCYRLIAADADRSGSVTTFDIVELRKLILGVYNELPNNDSWRFVDKAFSFPNKDNPFQSVFPESKTVNITSSAPGAADFVGIKIGDVNLTHIEGSGCKPVAHKESKQPYTLAFDAPMAKAGDLITIAVRNTGLESLAAFQGGLTFDVTALELTGIAPGEVAGFGQDCLGLLKQNEGEIRIVWLSPDFSEQLWAPNQTLCYLTFRAKHRRTEGMPVIKIDHTILENEVYTLDNQVFEVVSSGSFSDQRGQASNTPSIVEVSCMPNPATGYASMVIESARPEHVWIYLFNAFGAKVGVHELTLIRGRNQINLPEVPSLPAGVYTWTVMIGTNRASEGRLIKQ